MLRLTREVLTELSTDQLRSVAAAAATATCSAGCGHTLDLECEDGFTNGCTAHTDRICVTSIC